MLGYNMLPAEGGRSYRRGLKRLQAGVDDDTDGEVEDVTAYRQGL